MSFFNAGFVLMCYMQFVTKVVTFFGHVVLLLQMLQARPRE